MNSTLKSAAHAAEYSKTFRVLARGGYLASGIVHVLIGGLALTVARTGQGESDQTEALSTIAAEPLGLSVLWAIAALLLALGLFHIVAGLVQTGEDSTSKWKERVSQWGQGVTFCALGVVALSVATGTSSDGDSNAEDASRGLLDLPGGFVVLTLIGVGVLVGGVVYVVRGVTRKFTKKMRIPGGTTGKVVTALGVTGYAAKGVSVAVVGVLLALAGVRSEPESAGALDAAIQTLYDLPAGALIVALVGVGFIAYGLFSGFRARYAKL